MKMITILSAVSALVLLLTSCGTSENNKDEETTFTEGMDTVCTVTQLLFIWTRLFFF